MLNPEAKLNKNGFANIVVVIIALVVLAGVGAGYWVVKRQKAEAPPAPLKSVADETADWKTYRNDEYGFEIKYPPDWESGYDNPTAPKRGNFTHIRLSSDPTRSVSIQVTPAESVSSQPYYVLENDISKIALEMFSNVSDFEIVYLKEIPAIKTKYGFTIFHRNPNFEIFIADTSLVAEYGEFKPVDRRIIEKIVSTFQFAQ